MNLSLNLIQFCKLERLLVFSYTIYHTHIFGWFQVQISSQNRLSVLRIYVVFSNHCKEVCGQYLKLGRGH